VSHPTHCIQMEPYNASVCCCSKLTIEHPALPCGTGNCLVPALAGTTKRDPERWLFLHTHLSGCRKYSKMLCANGQFMPRAHALSCSHHTTQGASTDQHIWDCKLHQEELLLGC
jgi:hypothetical protein